MKIMISRAIQLVAHRCLLLLACCFLAGCSQAPSVDLLGSFFPAWLFCLVAAILMTAGTHYMLLRLHKRLAFPVLVYPSLAALFTLLLWAIFFH
jgi:YtcA family